MTFPDETTGVDLTLTVSEDLHRSLARRAEEHGFGSTEEYCETVLELVVEELEREGAGDEVEDRLEDLGYLS